MWIVKHSDLILGEERLFRELESSDYSDRV